MRIPREQMRNVRPLCKNDKSALLWIQRTISRLKPITIKHGDCRTEDDEYWVALSNGLLIWRVCRRFCRLWCWSQRSNVNNKGN